MATESQRPSNEDAARVRIPPPLLFLLPLLLAAALHYWVLPLPIVLPDVGPLSGRAMGIGIGTILVIMGILLVVGAMVQFNKLGDRPEPWTPTTGIILGGPYRFTRNPIYLSFVLITAGIAFVLPSYWMLGATVLGAVLVDRLAIRPEEEYLERKFDGPYLKFKRSVRRWL